MNKIPSVAFSVPDLDGQVKMQLKSKDDGRDLSCVMIVFRNGKSAHVKAVSYVAASVAGVSFAMTGVSALGALTASPAAAAGSTGPSFGVMMGWFHSMATNGMLSVNYPPIYRSFTRNFAFSTGLITWRQLQSSIDNFRKNSGGNITDDSYDFLHHSTLTFSNASSPDTSSKLKRGFDFAYATSKLFVPRDGGGGGQEQQNIISASGIKAFSEQLSVPHANTFMTVFLVFAIVVAAIVVSILLCKVILEMWAKRGNLPNKLAGLRNDYWGLMARTITNLILILYGVWVLYCIYEFTSGDSWAAKLLAAVTLVVFTAVLAFFTLRIWRLARKYKQTEGDTSRLYEDKETWRKYSLFYDNYKKDYWWIFIPVIVYSFAKGCVVAAGNGHGLAQSTVQLVIEALMLALLLWKRPYVAKSAQVINITIQVVRVLSIACVLVFVEELGFNQTTKTVTGVVIMVIQSVLTGVLAILIAANAVVSCIRENPHVRRRREAGKFSPHTYIHKGVKCRF